MNENQVQNQENQNQNQNELPENYIGKCPKCGRNVLERKEKYSCVGYSSHDNNGTPLCNFSVWKNTFGSVILPETMKELLENKVTSKKLNFMSRTGEVYSDYLILDLNQKYNLRKGSKWVTVGSCPKCGKDVVTNYNSKSYYCSDYKNCDFKIWKTICNVFLSEDIIKEILNYGETTDYLNFTSKHGKSFEAKIRLIAAGRVYNEKTQYTDLLFKNTNETKENQNIPEKTAAETKLEEENKRLENLDENTIFSSTNDDLPF